MEEPNNSTVLESEPPNEINGQTTDETEEVPMEIVKDDEATPARLVISNFDDESEETVLMTIEEAQNYILSKVETYIRDIDTNPLLVLKKQITFLHDKIKNENEEFTKLNKMFDALHRDQVKFLRHVGIIPKVDTQTIGVSVDLPWLPESMPGIINEDMLKNSSAGKTFLPTPNGPEPKLPKKDASGPIECIDLTDDADVSPAVSTAANVASTSKPTVSTPDSNAVSSSSTSSSVPDQNSPSTAMSKINLALQHPAPLPTVPPSQSNESEIPPKPRLKISVDKNGIVLQWDMPPEAKNLKITGYEIVGYQEKTNQPAAITLWKKIGCVDPMPLPMSCTLTQFVEGFKYHFSIRAFCKDNRYGHFSDPASIMFVPEPKKS